MNSLILNALLYLGTCLYYAKRDGIVTIPFFVSFLYFIFGLMGVYTVYSGIYFDTFGYYSVSNISFIPYLLNYVIFILMLRIINEKINKQADLIITNAKIFNTQLIRIIEYITIGVCVLFLILLLLWYMQNRGVTFAEIYMNRRLGERMFQSNGLLNFLYYRSYNFIKWISPIFLLLQLVKYVNTKKKQSIYFIVFFSIVLMLKSAVGADRASLFFLILDFVFFYIVFRNHFSHKMRKMIIIMSCFLGITIVGMLEGISVSRFESSNKYESGTIRYFGEAFPNLGLRIWNVSENYIYGARRFPTVFKFFGGYIPNFHNDTSLERWYFESKSKFPVDNFKTFYGDMYIEFGIIWPFGIILLMVVILKVYIRKHSDSGFSILFYYLTYMLLVWGLFGCKIDERFVANLFFYFLISHMIKHCFNKKELTNQ